MEKLETLIKDLRLPGREKASTSGRKNSDEYYVIGLCNEVLGMEGQQQYRFPFLLGDNGTPLPVDAYYPTLNLVVEYYERQHTETVKFFDRKVDSIDITVLHSYRNDFSLSGKIDTTMSLKKRYEQSSYPAYAVHVRYTEQATSEAIRRLKLPYNDPDRFFPEWRDVDDGVLSLDDNTILEYQAYNNTELVLQTNSKSIQTWFMLKNVKFGGIESNTGKPIREGEAIHSRAHINYRPKMTRDGARYSLYEDLIYRFQDADSVYYENTMESRGDAIFTGPLHTNLQPVYNIFFRELDIPDCSYCVLKIRFPSATSFEITSIPPDEITPLSIIYNTPESIKKIANQGLYVNARPLSNNNFIETRNFILATLIGALLSIIIELIISLVKDYSHMLKAKQKEKQESYPS